MLVVSRRGHFTFAPSLVGGVNPRATFVAFRVFDFTGLSASFSGSRQKPGGWCDLALVELSPELFHSVHLIGLAAI